MTQTPPNTPQQNSPRTGPPWPLILIVATIVIPIVAAYVTYFTGMGVSEETVNKGALLQPPAKVESLLASSESDTLPDMSERKWRMLVPVTAPCDELCQKNLYTTRQVHIRLGDKSPRVERWAVNLSGEQGERFLAEIQAEHPFLEHFSVPAEQWQEWLSQSNAPESVEQTPYYLLADPEGFAMMYYTTDHHGNDLLDDIKRVLRYTPE